jgi:hypothetical protein
MLKKNPNSLVHQMIYREVDFAIYEILWNPFSSFMPS